MPRKRLGLAAACASSTGATSSPNDRSANPTMAAATRVLIAESEAARSAIRFKKLCFADGFHLLGTIFAIAITAFDGDRGNDVVAAAEIRCKSFSR